MSKALQAMNAVVDARQDRSELDYEAFFDKASSSVMAKWICRCGCGNHDHEQRCFRCDAKRS